MSRTKRVDKTEPRHDPYPTTTLPRHPPQITTTLPVRTSFYILAPYDYIRAVMEVLLLICVAIVAYSQLWQYKIVQWQYGGTRMFYKQFWNIMELLSTGALCLWIVLYAALAIVLAIFSPG